MKIRNEEDWIVTIDYMIKLQGKMHQSNSSKFHVLMTKGCSVHLFCIKRHMAKDEANAMLAEKGAEKVEYQILCIDSFPLTQYKGGKKLCVLLMPT